MFALASLFEPGARLLNFARPLPFNIRETRGARRVLAVHGDTRPEKMWPLDRYDRVLTEFLRANRRWRVVALNFSPDQLPNACATNRTELVRGVALSEAMRSVAAADLFLGIDSCMLHVADLCKVPGVALFGPTRAEQFGYCIAPRSRVRNLQANAATEEISIDQVGEALEVVRKQIERR
jgi:ADP-heptose:LPS heptosyltransferase